MGYHNGVQCHFAVIVCVGEGQFEDGMASWHENVIEPALKTTMRPVGVEKAWF